MSSQKCATLGLSPRVRGNPATGHPRTPKQGSIPACAGEPYIASTLRACCRVYPRVCGGTPRSIEKTRRDEGLSPRVRGNRVLTVCGLL